MHYLHRHVTFTAQRCFFQELCPKTGSDQGLSPPMPREHSVWMGAIWIRLSASGGPRNKRGASHHPVGRHFSTACRSGGGLQHTD